jgi:hypothetical protein
VFINGQFGKIAGGDNNSWNRGNTIYKEFWTPETPNVVFPANDEKANPWAISMFDKRNKCDFIRLQDVTLSYRFSKSIVEKLSASQLDIYCNAKNLYTWTNWGWGPDPEFSNQRGTPFIMSIISGIRLTF